MPVLAQAQIVMNIFVQKDHRITDFSLSSEERKTINFQEGLKSSFNRGLNMVAYNTKDLNLKQTQEALLSF